MNGFIDRFAVQHFRGDWDAFFGACKVGELSGIRCSDISLPTETISLGERRIEADDDAYMEIWPPEFGSDHLTDVAHSNHRWGGGDRLGGSNYGFANASVRFLKF